MERPGSPAWNALLGRVVASLDDDGMAAYAKSQADMERKRERNRKSGIEAEYDFYMVQEILVEFDRCGVFCEAVANCGGRESECLGARKVDADIALVWDSIEGRIGERLKTRAMDIAQWAQAELGEAVRDGGRKTNVKALELALVGSVPGLYGKSGRRGFDEADAGKRQIPMGGGGIMINVIGDAAVKLLKPAVEGKAGGVFIDV